MQAVTFRVGERVMVWTDTPRAYQYEVESVADAPTCATFRLVDGKPREKFPPEFTIMVGEVE